MPKKNDTSKYERVTFTHNGKRYSRYGKTLKEAVAKAERLRIALENGEIGISGKMTVSAWADEWLQTYKAHSVGEGQYKNLILYLGIVKAAIGSKKLKDVKDVDLQRILNQRIYNEKRQKARSRSDLSKLRMIIMALFKRARQSRLISYDPAESLELPAVKDGTHRSITDNERAEILKLAETHHAGLWIKMILYCGLRPGETRALDWRHINFEKQLIHVEQAMKAHTTVIDAPKTPSGIRNIPIPNNYLSDLLAVRKGSFEPVFIKPKTGTRHDKSSMENMWKNFKRELDITMGAKVYRNKITMSVVADDLVPYCLRHTYGTDLQDAGVPINIAKYLMGHSDISTTANIYTHTTDDVIADAAKKINQRVLAKKM